MKTSIFSVLKLSAVLALSTTHSSYAGNVRLQDVFTDEVIGVDDGGSLMFRDESRYRLWGVDPDVEYLRSFIVGKRLFCTIVGNTLSHRRPVSVADCREPYGTPGYPRSIAEHLINSGHGTEFCPESSNWFKTCLQ